MIGGISYTQWSSNDYLGLSQHPAVIKAAAMAMQDFGVGSTGSRLLGGDSEPFHLLETRLAQWLKKPATLVFNSGYQMNSGIIRTIVGKNDVIFADKLIHASLIDGSLYSGATLFRFKHNDMKHLQSLLQKHRGSFKKSLIISESLFSMDGDLSDLKSLVDLKKHHDSELMIDEAHSVGIYENEYRQDIDYVLGTLGKAFGCAGGFVGCSADFKDRFINTARNFIYSTALPPLVAAAALEALSLIENGVLGQQLQKNTKAVRALFHDFSLLGETHIMPLLIGDEAKTVAIADTLRQAGHWVTAVRHPTVALGQARLRLCLSLTHTEKDWAGLLSDLSQTT